MNVLLLVDWLGMAWQQKAISNTCAITHKTYDQVVVTCCYTVNDIETEQITENWIVRDVHEMSTCAESGAIAESLFPRIRVCVLECVSIYSVFVCDFPFFLPPKRKSVGECLRWRAGCLNQWAFVHKYISNDGCSSSDGHGPSELCYSSRYKCPASINVHVCVYIFVVWRRVATCELNEVGNWDFISKANIVRYSTGLFEGFDDWLFIINHSQTAIWTEHRSDDGVAFAIIHWLSSNSVHY